MKTLIVFFSSGLIPREASVSRGIFLFFGNFAEINGT